MDVITKQLVYRLLRTQQYTIKTYIKNSFSKQATGKCYLQKIRILNQFARHISEHSLEKRSLNVFCMLHKCPLQQILLPGINRAASGVASITFCVSISLPGKIRFFSEQLQVQMQSSSSSKKCSITHVLLNDKTDLKRCMNRTKVLNFLNRRSLDNSMQYLCTYIKIIIIN